MAKVRQTAWRGVRMRRTRASADPDGIPRRVELPALWDDAAADALAALVPGSGPVSLADAAETWLGRLPAHLANEASRCLLARRAAPDAEIWAGNRACGYALNLAAFDEPGLGLDAASLRETASLAVVVLRTLAPDAAPVLRVTDLDGLLAASGLEYGSAAGRDAAASVIALVSEAAAGVRLVGAAGVADALLGAEAGGVAPRFDWLDACGRLSRAAMAFLAARGMSAEGALAAALAGHSPLRLADATSHAAMREVLGRFLALPELAHPAAATTRREPPARPGGYAKRVTLGGHRLFVRTAEFADGGVAEVSLGLPRESAAARALADSLSQLASLALQHGTPLADIVDLLAGTRFGPAGAVEGDTAVPRASSPLDYLARSLAAAYLPSAQLDPVEEEHEAPRLPLDMPQQPRPRLRIVR